MLNAPDLLFLRDTDGDGRADREVVVTGFGRADTHELPSTLTWGPDGWLYGLNGVFNPSRVESEAARSTPSPARCGGSTRGPASSRSSARGRATPTGIAWDPEGSAIVEACHWANDHLFHFVETGYYKRQAGAYPPFTMQIGSITDHGHQKTAYCGLAYFDSDAYPEQYRDRLYTGNIHGGCVNVDRLTRDGSTYVARAEPDLLTANDAWFMPVAQKVGPDGCLYVLDWYDRYHCYQDANRDPQGIDRLKGRLYRVRYGDSPRAPEFDLAGESDEALIRRLASPNIYFRESAQRLLTERDTPVRPRPAGGAGPGRRRHPGRRGCTGSGRWSAPADWTRGSTPGCWATPTPPTGPGASVPPGTQAGVAPAGPRRGSRRWRGTSPRTFSSRSPSPRGRSRGWTPLPVLVEVLVHCGEDKLIPAIAWPNLHPLLPDQGDRFVRLVEAVDLRDAPALARLLPRVVDRLLGEPDSDLEPVRAIVDAARGRGRRARPGVLLGRLRTGRWSCPRRGATICGPGSGRSCERILAGDPGAPARVRRANCSPPGSGWARSTPAPSATGSPRRSSPRPSACKPWRP